MIRGLFLVRRVQGMSMSPALQPGMIIFASRWFKNIAPGQVVIISHNGLEKIKRVTDKSDKGLFVTGDNPHLSTDSRQFGWINEQDVIGRVFWPIVH